MAVELRCFVWRMVRVEVESWVVVDFDCVVTVFTVVDEGTVQVEILILLEEMMEEQAAVLAAGRALQEGARLVQAVPARTGAAINRTTARTASNLAIVREFDFEEQQRRRSQLERAPSSHHIFIYFVFTTSRAGDPWSQIGRAHV